MATVDLVFSAEKCEDLLKQAKEGKGKTVKRLEGQSRGGNRKL